MSRLFLLLLASVIPALSMLPRPFVTSVEGRELPRLKVDAGHFVDPEGRVVILRGVNMASKGSDYRLISDPRQLDNLPRWGLNVVRLAFNWEAYEPKQNDYNGEYLAHYVSVVKEIGNRGMYVLVDFHQDAFSRWAVGGCGEGFPEWTVPEELRQTPVDQNDPVSIIKGGCTDWGTKELRDRNVRKLFDNLYNRASRVGEGFLAMVKQVANAVKSFPQVVGFDILNEPVGTMKENAKLIPFYQEAGKQIRDVIPTAVLFIEPQMTVSVGIIPSFLKKPNLDNVVYAPHFYDGFVHLMKGYYFQSVRFQMGFQYRYAKKWSSPYFLGEFGIDPSYFASRKYIENIYSNMDRLWASGAQWGYTPFWNDVTKDGWNLEDFSIVGENGEVRSIFDPARPYVRYVSGTPGRAMIDTKRKTVDVTWTSGEKPKGETEIFLPREFYGDNLYRMATSKGLRCEIRANLFLPDVTDRVVCTVDADAPSRQVKLRLWR